jgi:16S rRNA (cytosine967-C5)-methyltransferase
MKHVTTRGRLVYATCSLESEENERVIQQALQENPSFQLRDCRLELEPLIKERALAWKDVDSLLKGPFLRTIPGLHPCDGFFAAVLERN